MGSSVTYYGHATLLIEVGGTRVLTDPVLRSRILHLRRRMPPPSLDELRPFDAVVISHAHADHLDPRSLRRLGAHCEAIVPMGCRRLLRHSRADVLEVAAGDRVAVGATFAEVLHAEHDGRRWHLGPRREALGYLFEGPPSVYFAGDTDLYPGMGELAGRVDVALLPIWGWGPSVPAGHLDPRRAAEAVSLIAPRVVIPIHWGTFVALGSQRGADPSAPTREFAERVAETSPRVEVRTLMPGARLDL